MDSRTRDWRKTPILAAFAFAAALSGCKESPEKAALRDLRLAFNDPDSVQVREVRVVLDEFRIPGVCGEVNAKNKFGGYTGFRPFMVKGHDVVIQSDDPDLALFQTAALRTCLELPPTKLSAEDRDALEAFRPR